MQLEHASGAASPVKEKKTSGFKTLHVVGFRAVNNVKLIIAMIVWPNKKICWVRVAIRSL